MLKRFIWKGPPTAVEVWPEPAIAGGDPLFSGQVAPGREIPVDLDEDHSQVATWRAFGLIEAAPLPKATKKEKADG